MSSDNSPAKKVLSIGQCMPDGAALRRLIENTFAARVTPVDDGPAALAALAREPFALVLVNRKLDVDYSDGLDIIRQIKADPQLAGVPCMLVTNYPEHQQTALAAGAELGFGKQELQLPETHAKLAKFLA